MKIGCRYYRLTIMGSRKTLTVYASNPAEALGAAYFNGIEPEYITSISLDIAAQAAYERHKLKKRLFSKILKHFL